MKVMHMISGGDSGGAKTHLFALLDKLCLKCDIVVACLMKGVFYEEILEKDIETVLFEQQSRLDLSVVNDIRKFIAERKIELLHVHGARANFIAMFLKKKINIPIVTTMHSDYLLDFDSFLKKIIFTNLNKLSLRKIDYFIAVSDNFKDMLIDRDFRPNNIHTVYNGMDYSEVPQNPTSKEDFAKAYNIEYDPECTYVGIAARFDLVKGVDVFIKGACEAYKKNPKLRFLIAGEGVEVDNLKTLKAALEMDNAITFLGFVTDIYGFLNFIDINTLTSLNESFPYSMLEGAAMKKPMVASRVGGIPDLVKDGETGYLFESRNYHDFAEKLLLLADNKEDMEKMGERIFERATTKFSSEVLACDHMNIYNRILCDFNDKKEYDFVLSGYYGFNNSGDDALLLALITDLKAQKEDVKIAVLSSNPRQTKVRYKVDAQSRISPFKLRKLFRCSRVLLSGGGSLIQDETSSKSLWYYLYVISMAKKCGMKVMQIASGIGPVRKKNNRKITAKVINKNVDIITLREEKSLAELKDMNVKVPVEVTADPAVSLEGESKKKVAELFEKCNIPTGDYICVAVREWKKATPGFENHMAKALDYIFEKYNKNIVFVPMQYPTDLGISQSISKKMKNKSYVVEKETTIREVIGIIGNSSLVIAMRLHSLVYAVSCGVGIIALKYDPKIDGFMEYFRQKYIADVAGVTEEEMKSLADRFFLDEGNNQSEILCREMKEKAKRNAVLAVEQLL